MQTEIGYRIVNSRTEYFTEHTHDYAEIFIMLTGRARHTAYALIVGLSLGSILSMFCNGDIMQTYTAWAQNGVAVLDLTLGIALFAVGVVGSYLLVRYQRKKDAETAAQGQ